MLGNIASECVIRIWYVDVILFIFIMVSFININISKYVYTVYTFMEKNPVKSMVSANIKTRFRTLKTRFQYC